MCYDLLFLLILHVEHGPFSVSTFLSCMYIDQNPVLCRASSSGPREGIPFRGRDSAVEAGKRSPSRAVNPEGATRQISPEVTVMPGGQTGSSQAELGLRNARFIVRWAFSARGVSEIESVECPHS